MKNYKYIINPLNNKIIKINSQLGKRIIINYIKYLKKGGAVGSVKLPENLKLKTIPFNTLKNTKQQNLIKENFTNLNFKMNINDLLVKLESDFETASSELVVSQIIKGTRTRDPALVVSQIIKGTRTRDPALLVERLTKLEEGNIFIKLFKSYVINIIIKIKKYKKEFYNLFIKNYFELENYLTEQMNDIYNDLGVQNIQHTDLENIFPTFAIIKQKISALAELISEYTSENIKSIDNQKANLIYILTKEIGYKKIWQNKIVWEKFGSNGILGKKMNNSKFIELSGIPINKDNSMYYTSLYAKPAVYYLAKMNEIKYLKNILPDKFNIRKGINLDEINSDNKDASPASAASASLNITDAAQVSPGIKIDNNKWDWSKIKINLDELNIISIIDLFEKYKKKYLLLIKEIKNITSSLKDCNNKELSKDIDSRYSINNLIVQLIVGFANDAKSFSNRHLNIILYGNAGTGKTRYGKIIANILGHLGILLKASDKTIDIISSQSLIGQYIGQSAPKTRTRLSKNIENVLFIDEAYQLSIPDPDTGRWNEYGEEVITELVAFLSEYVGQICIICAGYPNEMLNNFMIINQGIPRRFPWKIPLSDYSIDELVAILCKFLNKKEEGFVKKYLLREQKTYETLYEILKINKNTLLEYNAGDIENLANMMYSLTKLRTDDSPLTSQQIIAIIKQYCIDVKGLHCDINNIKEIIEEAEQNITNNVTAQSRLKLSIYKKKFKELQNKYPLLYTNNFIKYMKLQFHKQINKQEVEIPHKKAKFNWINAENDTIDALCPEKKELFKEIRKIGKKNKTVLPSLSTLPTQNQPIVNTTHE